MKDEIRYRVQLLLLVVFLTGGLLAPILHPFSHSLSARKSGTLERGGASAVETPSSTPAVALKEPGDPPASACRLCGKLSFKITFDSPESVTLQPFKTWVTAVHQLYVVADIRALSARGPPSLSAQAHLS